MTAIDTSNSLVEDLLTLIKGDLFWENYLGQLINQEHTPFTLHLAIFVEPYLQFILEGKKTIESRFSVHRCSPYKQVHTGDVILLKRSGGPIVGLCEVADTWFYKLDPTSWRMIKVEFAQAICVQDPAFWKERESASFATLMRIKRVRAIEPLEYTKRDRRGWVILQAVQSQLRFDNI